MSRAPSRRALDAMTLDELVVGLHSRGEVWPLVEALTRRDPAEVGQRALDLIKLGPRELSLASYLFEASGGPHSPAKVEAAPILKSRLRRPASVIGAILCLGKLGLFSQIRDHRRFLEPNYGYPVRWAATMALEDCLLWPLEPGAVDWRAIESLIGVARMRAADTTDFGAVSALATGYQYFGLSPIGAFIDEVKAGPPSAMQRRVIEELADD